MRMPGNPSSLLVHRDWVRNNVYGLVLTVLILLIVFASSLIGFRLGLLIIDVLLFLVSLIIARAFIWGQQKIFWGYVFSAGVISVLDGVCPYLFSGFHLTIVTAVTVISYAILVLIALVIIITRVLRERAVTADVMFGGICIYMLFGFFWFLLYQLIAVVDPAAFRTVNKMGYFELLYFSFNTLTTLGYGDIVPVNRFAQALCNLEAIAGQMFPAVFISRLVSLYVVAESGRQREDDDVSG